MKIIARVTSLVLFFCLFVPQMVSAQDLTESEWVCPAGLEGQTLRIFNWSTYMGEDTVPEFEKRCGVTVEYFEFSSNEELVGVLRANSAAYDVVFPSSNAVTRLIVEGLVQELDHDLLPNLENLSETFEDRPHDPNYEYSIPYQWGTVGIGFDRAMITDDQFETWEDFFAYEGRVAWIDDNRIMLGLALNHLGFDPNSFDGEEINAAADWLLSSPNEVYQIAQDNGQDLLALGEVDAVVEYSGDMYQIITSCNCEDFGYVVPNDGTNVWIDGVAIPTNSPNPTLAHAFLDFLMDPLVAAANSNYIQYASPNEAAMEFIDEAMRTNSGIYPDAETIANGFLVLDTADAEIFYNEAWSRVSAALAE